MRTRRRKAAVRLSSLSRVTQGTTSKKCTFSEVCVCVSERTVLYEYDVHLL